MNYLERNHSWFSVSPAHKRGAAIPPSPHPSQLPISFVQSRFQRGSKLSMPFVRRFSSSFSASPLQRGAAFSHHTSKQVAQSPSPFSTI